MYHRQSRLPLFPSLCGHLLYSADSGLKWDNDRRSSYLLSFLFFLVLFYSFLFFLLFLSFSLSPGCSFVVAVVVIVVVVGSFFTLAVARLRCLVNFAAVCLVGSMHRLAFLVTGSCLLNWMIRIWAGWSSPTCRFDNWLWLVGGQMEWLNQHIVTS